MGSYKKLKNKSYQSLKMLNDVEAVLTLDVKRLWRRWIGKRTRGLMGK